MTLLCQNCKSFNSIKNTTCQNCYEQEIQMSNIIDMIDDLKVDDLKVDEKVYDLTIEDTRNFMILGGLNVRDTFHSTGSGVKEM